MVIYWLPSNPAEEKWKKSLLSDSSRRFFHPLTWQWKRASRVFNVNAILHVWIYNYLKKISSTGSTTTVFLGQELKSKVFICVCFLAFLRHVFGSIGGSPRRSGSWDSLREKLWSRGLGTLNWPCHHHRAVPTSKMLRKTGGKNTHTHTHFPLLHNHDTPFPGLSPQLFFSIYNVMGPLIFPQRIMWRRLGCH